MPITPFIPSGRRFYSVSFRRPDTGDPVNRSLGTEDWTAAKNLALWIERMILIPDSWDINHPINQDLPPAAVKAFHGRFAPKLERKVTLSPDIVNVVAEMAAMPGAVTVEVAADDDAAAQLAQARQELIENKEVLAARDEELKRLHRRFNAHITATLGEAFAAWKSGYARGRAKATIGDTIPRVSEFVAFTGGKLKLADLRGKHIDAWLEIFREKWTDAEGEEREPLEPQSIRRRRGCVSVFLSWAIREYEMHGNPIDHAQPIAGVARTPEQIVCIRRLDELNALLDGLQGYWRAVAAVGCLAGLRLAELVWLKRSDVYLDDGYLRCTSREGHDGEVTGTKTGRERPVALERTRLRGIVREYIESKGDGRWRDDWPWFFPSIVETPTWSPRRVTPPGLWCNGNNFRFNLQKALDAAQAKAPEAMRGAACWTYGPWEWRHTAGTAMGLSGLTTRDIAKLLGNSPDVCERHYIGVSGRDVGTRWPFVW